MLRPGACVLALAVAVVCAVASTTAAGAERPNVRHFLADGDGDALAGTPAGSPPNGVRNLAPVGAPSAVGDGPVPPGFTNVGLALQGCEFVSTNQSTFTFNFDLTLLSEFAGNAPAPNLVVWEAPPGRTLVYYASPCNDLNIPDVPPFQGSCSGDMAVCFCSSDYQRCDNIAVRSTINWLVWTKSFDALTVVQQFTAPNCESDYSKSWMTYLIYECDVTPSGYALGQRSQVTGDEWGLCPATTDPSCTQCILWKTNYACEPFASSMESFLQFESGWSPEVVSGSGTPSLVTLITRTQFQQALGYGGDYVVATAVGDDASLLSWTVTDNLDGTYELAFFAAAGLAVGATYTYNVTVSLDGDPVESFLLSAIGSPHGDPGGSDVVGIVLGTLGGIVAIALVVMGVRFAKGYPVCPTGHEVARRAAAGREAASFGATAGANTYGALPTYQQASLDDADGL